MKKTLNSADELLQKAILLHQQGQLSEAQRLYEKILQNQPKHFDALHYLGVIAYQTGNHLTAIELMNQAIKIKQTIPSIYSNYGNVLLKLEQYEAALASYDQAIALKSDYAEAYNNRGQALEELKQFNEALASYDQAIALKSDYANAYNNQGNAFLKLKHYNGALASYNKTISLKPDHGEAYNNRGLALQELKQFDAALANYSQAIKLKPDYPEAYYNRGTVLQKLKQFDTAIENYDKALALKPDYKFLPSIRMHIKMQICDWSHFSDEVNQLTTLIQQHKKSSQPFEILSLIDSLSLHRKAAEIYVEDRYSISLALPEIQKYPRHKKIRIGYYSADFKEHPVSFLTAELYELHDRNKFEIVAFSLGHVPQSSIRLRLEAAFDKFIDVSNRSDKDLVLLSRHLEIDIAVDLGGFTESNRHEIFSLRVAPLQVSYLGFLGTMGAEYIDYLIADKTIVPQQNQHYYSEKMVYLPSYQVNDSKRDIADRPFTREELGLPEHGFVFCCFNNNYKITPKTFDGWMRILQRVNNSVLFLYADHETAEKNLKKEAIKRGVEPSRLFFGKKLPRPDYLARYRVADLFLDTLPYNAGTTASDALWAGLPVLTCMGETFASRVATSLLTAIDLPELITTSQADYEALAVKLAKHPDQLKTLKQKLQTNRLTKPLFNTPLFTQHIENAYTQMYERYQADLPPDHIYVENSSYQQASADIPMKTLLHVSYSHNTLDKTAKGFNNGRWKELRLDIDTTVNPDIVGTMTDMSCLKNTSVDAIFSSHTLQSLYPHEVPIALKEFHRVLKEDGFCIISCPDLKSVCERAVQDKLTEPAYLSPVGPITPFDSLYGHSDFLAKDTLFRAHHCGFTEKVLQATLNACDFQSIATLTRSRAFECWALACKKKKSDDELRKLAQEHFPF